MTVPVNPAPRAPAPCEIPPKKILPVKSKKK